MKRIATIFFSVLLLVCVIWLIIFNAQTHLFREVHGLIVSEVIYNKLMRIEDSKPSRTHLEKTFFRKMRAVEVSKKENSICFVPETVDEYRVKYPGLRRIKYTKYDVIFFDVLYDGKGRMVAFLNCY